MDFIPPIGYALVARNGLGFDIDIHCHPDFVVANGGVEIYVSSV